MMKRISIKMAGRVWWLAVCGVLAAAPGAARAAAPKILYQNNFEKAAVDSLPEGFLALEGDFKVKEETG